MLLVLVLTGKYAYFSPRSDAKSSVLASPALTPSDDEYCVQFWYFLFGIAPVELKLGLGDNKSMLYWKFLNTLGPVNLNACLY